MGKAIKSDNVLKPTIVTLLKVKSGATRVTCVKEVKDEEGNKLYAGDCLQKSTNGNYYLMLGTFTVRADTVLNHAYKNRNK